MAHPDASAPDNTSVSPTSVSPTTDHPTTVSVAFTDVIDALVSPVQVELSHPAGSALRLRPVDPSDHSLPSHHDTVVHDVVLMEDFAGELRRWLASTTR